jgi:hypothetical protein
VVEQRPRRDHPDQRAGQDVRHVVPLEVDAAERDGGRQGVEEPRHPRVERREHGGDDEDGRRVSGRKGVDIRREGGAPDHEALVGGVGSGPAHEVLQGELDETRARKAQRSEPRRLPEP